MKFNSPEDKPCIADFHMQVEKGVLVGSGQAGERREPSPSFWKVGEAKKIGRGLPFDCQEERPTQVP